MIELAPLLDDLHGRLTKLSRNPSPENIRALSENLSPEKLRSHAHAAAALADKRDRELEYHDAVRGHIENIFRAALKNVLAHAAAQMVRKIRRQAPVKNRLFLNAAPQSAVARLMFDLDELTKRFEAQIESALREAFDESGRAMMDEIDPAAEFVTPQGVARKFVIERQNKLKNVPQEIYDEVKNELEQGSAEGETEPQLGARVKKVMGDIEDGRALTIARTETATAYNAGRMAALRQVGFTHKQWLTAHDDRVRLTHNNAEADGAIPIDEPFSNGLMYPGDETGPASEVINCRCVLQGADAP
ncbi:MAG: hypothetical protein KGL39_33485 [Patescibacteria group bacterium]|nr:hypothetical protein [Patescibacteria group bacterium]